MPEKTASKIGELVNTALVGKINVILAFLFGSHASDNASFLSDVDIAVLFSSPPAIEEIHDLKDLITGALKTEVDIVDLHKVSPVIKMQVLKNGRLLINRNPRAYNDFYVTAVNEYDDLKRVRKEIERKILRGRTNA